MLFEETIKEWVSLDNEIKLYNEKIKSIRDKKNNITTTILKHVESNNLTNNQIKIANGKIKFIPTSISPPITFKYLESCLHDIIKNENQVKQIIEYIKQKREPKKQLEIKRYYDN
jgi:hypothetical protein